MNTQTQVEIVLAVGERPGESVVIPAEMLPARFRRDGELRVMLRLDRTDFLAAL